MFELVCGCDFGFVCTPDEYGLVVTFVGIDDSFPISWLCVFGHWTLGAMSADCACVCPCRIAPFHLPIHRALFKPS